MLQVAILEKDITTVPTTGNVTTGETSFGYVLKKMLPDAAGTSLKIPLKLVFRFQQDRLHGYRRNFIIVIC